MTEQETKERLIQATSELLNEIDDINKITAREITSRAGVGLGSINYHFHNKDNLLNEAVMRITRATADRWLILGETEGRNPVERIKMLIRETSKILLRYPKFAEFSIWYALQHGDFTVSQLLLPLLREFYGPDKDEQTIRVISFQIVVALQVAFVRRQEFRRYCEIDVYNDAQRDQAIDLLVDSILSKE